MELDLEKIASRRRRHLGVWPMSYLFDRVNDELAQRISVQARHGDNWLMIDFIDSTLQLEQASVPRGITQISLLEQGFGLVTDAVQDTLYDLVLVNMQLAWLDHVALLQQLRKCISPGGQLFFSTFGPDTLIELREAWRAVDTLPHVHGFTDMHHLGDQLVRCGFAKPIVDADWLGVEYEDVDLLMNDLRQEGFHNLLSGRRKTLTSKGRMALFRQGLASQSPVQVTFELIYGYAEVPIKAGDGVRVAPPLDP